jgi:hypothetical protein
LIAAPNACMMVGYVRSARCTEFSRVITANYSSLFNVSDQRAAWEFDIDAKEKKKSIGAPKSLEAQRPLPRCRGVVN